MKKTTAVKKSAPVKAKSRAAGKVVREGVRLGVLVEGEAPAPEQIGRAARHPRTGRPRG